MTGWRGLTRRQAMTGLAASAVAGLVATPASARAQGTPTKPYPSMIGTPGTYIVREKDTLVELAPRFRVGFTELIAANPGIDPWLPAPGTKLVVPAAHLIPRADQDGIVVNLADQRLYLFEPETGTIDTAPIGIGSAGWGTPLGRTNIRRKRIRPTWYVPKSIRAEQPELPAVVRPGPDNPLGEYALDLALPSYLIHGTNAPFGVGRRVSHGCIRLYPKDIERIFGKAAVGLAVRITDQPVKLGWVAGRLLMEAHPTQSQADELEKYGKFTPAREPELEYQVLQAAADSANRIDWKRVRRTVRERRGVPVEILAPPGR